MKSVLQKNRECFVCGTTLNLHNHHCLYGSGRRKLADKYGLTVYLCQEHHTGQTGVHMNPNKAIDLKLKTMAQTYYEERIGTRGKWMEEFGKNYL